jgi:phosphate/phosphite/phosphonate ABC transporter binding protein
MNSVRRQCRMIWSPLAWGLAWIAILFLWSGCNRRSDQVSGKEETITISGSASAIPTVRALAVAYEKANPSERIHFLPSVHSSGGVMGVKDGTFDIGVVSRALTAEEGGFPICRYPFAKDLLVFATHPGIKVRGLSRKEILQIYAGKITNWKHLGGPDQEIVVLDRPEYSSAKQALKKSLFRGNFALTQKAIILERPEQMDVSLQSIQGSIGYTAFSDLHVLGTVIPILRVDGIKPTLKNLQVRENTSFRIYTFVFRDRPQGMAKRFMDFVYSPPGQNIIRSRGLVPDRRKIVIALVPAINIVEQETRYRPLIQYLTRKSGIPMEVKYAPTYRAIVRDFSKKSFDGAFLGSFAYALVHNRTPLEVLARPEENGKSSYRGILFVRKDSRIKSFRDLRGKTFCFVDKATTAGYLFPLIYFKEHGIDRPDTFLKKIVYSGTHDASIKSVLNRDADAGVAKNLVFQDVSQEHPRVRRELEVLASSLPVPTNGLSVRKDVDWDMKEDLKRILLQMDQDTEGREVLKRFGADRFLPTSDGDYRNLYAMIKRLGLDLKGFSIQKEGLSRK